MLFKIPSLESGKNKISNKNLLIIHINKCEILLNYNMIDNDKI